MTSDAAEIAEFRSLLAQSNASAAGDASIEARRAMMETASAAKAPPDGCRVETSVFGGVECDVLTPTHVRDGAVILYLHGGAHSTGSPRTHRTLVAQVARAARAVAVVPEFRLAPEHPFPAGLDDANAVYDALLDAPDLPRIVVAGDSSGGGLALSLSLQRARSATPPPAGACIFSPWVDLTQSSDTYRSKAAVDPLVSKARLDATAALYLAGHDPRDPIASPLFGDYSGVAPLLIQVGSEEVLLGEAAGVALAAGSAGVDVRLEIWPQMIHAWHAFADRLDAGRRAIRVAGAWIAEKISAPT